MEPYLPCGNSRVSLGIAIACGLISIIRSPLHELWRIVAAAGLSTTVTINSALVWWAGYSSPTGTNAAEVYFHCRESYPSRKAALFLQIERRLYQLMDLQVATQIPLVSQ